LKSSFEFKSQIRAKKGPVGATAQEPFSFEIEL